MMADAPANEAFQRYQQSAAAAAADQGTAEPAVSQATPPDVRSKVYCSCGFSGVLPASFEPDEEVLLTPAL